MEYDKTIQKRTYTELVETVHIDKIDWEGYNFYHPEHRNCMGGSEDAKVKRINDAIIYLKMCENGSAVVYDTYGYGGKNVIKVGMVSKWPYWEPRPCVLVDGAFGGGYEWIDWLSIGSVREEVKNES